MAGDREDGGILNTTLDHSDESPLHIKTSHENLGGSKLKPKGKAKRKISAGGGGGPDKKKGSVQRQWSTASATSRTSFDCMGPQTDDSAELLSYSWK